MNLSPAVQTALDRLGPAASAVRCRELVALLESLGFTVRRGRRGNHRIVTHAGLDDFLGTSFDCGHGRDPEVRPVYVRKLRRVIEMYAQALGERE